MPQTTASAGAIYQVGDLLRLKATFTDVDGAVADPTTVAVTVLTPGGTETEWTCAGGDLTRVSTGIYYYDFSVTESGKHYFTWSAGGAYVASDQGAFQVAKSAI